MNILNKFLTLVFLAPIAVVNAQIPQQVAGFGPRLGDAGVSSTTTGGATVHFVASGNLWMDEDNTAVEVAKSPIYRQMVGILDGILFFAGFTADKGLELYKYDGTSTTLVRNFSKGVKDRQFGINNYVVMNGLLYFVTKDDINGSEVWSTDGTTTTRVTDIAYGLDDSFPENREVFNNKLYFTANDGSGRELYEYDGSTINKLQGGSGKSDRELGDLGVNFYGPVQEFTKMDTTLFYPDVLATLDLSVVFTVDGGNDLTFSAVSSDETVIIAAISGTNLELIMTSLGSATIKVMATDALGATTGLILDVEVINPYLTYSGADFVELDNNDGAIDSGEIAISIAGDTFVYEGADFIEGTHYTVDNLPSGLRPVMTISSDGHQGILRLEGNADDHDAVHSVNDLQFTFTDAAFSSGDASVINNAVAARSGVGVHFIGCVDSYEVSETVCGSFDFDGQTLITSGTYKATYSTSSACDSLVTLYLTILEPTRSEVEVRSCESYEWNGTTYKSSGTYEQLFFNENGCDSLVTLKLTILDPSSAECNPLTTHLSPKPEKEAVKIYPNPTTGTFSADLNKEYKNIEMYIMGMNGSIIATRVYHDTSLIDHFIKEPAGKYRISVMGDGIPVMHRIIIKK